MHIAGSQELMREHGYQLRRVGPLVWAVIDTEDESGEDVEVCRANSPANAFRQLAALRFDGLEG